MRVAVDWHYWCASVAVVGASPEMLKATHQAGNCSQVRQVEVGNHSVTGHSVT